MCFKFYWNKFVGKLRKLFILISKRIGWDRIRKILEDFWQNFYASKKSFEKSSKA